MKYFRNKTEISGIEPESLWKLSEDGTKLILADEDEFIFVNYQENKQNFYEVKI